MKQPSSPSCCATDKSDATKKTTCGCDCSPDESSSSGYCCSTDDSASAKCCCAPDKSN